MEIRWLSTSELISNVIDGINKVERVTWQRPYNVFNWIAGLVVCWVVTWVFRSSEEIEPIVKLEVEFLNEQLLILMICGDKPWDANCAHNAGESYGWFDSSLRYQILDVDKPKGCVRLILGWLRLDT